MKITKLIVAGNDFLVVDYKENTNYQELAKKLLNRRFSVGADKLIVAKTNPLELLLFDNNGNREIANGNALTAYSKYLFDNKHVRKKIYDVIFGGKSINIEIISEIPFVTRINLDKPNYNNSMLYIKDSVSTFGRIINVNGLSFPIYSLNLLGVNTVVFIDKSNKEMMLNIAKEISEYKIFDKKTNVIFTEVIDKHNIKVITYSIDAEFNSTIGSAVASAMVVANKLGYIKSRANCQIEYGKMIVEINKKGQIYLESMSETLFELNLEEE